MLLPATHQRYAISPLNVKTLLIIQQGLLNPNKSHTKKDCRRIIHVISRMEWYDNPSTLLSHSDKDESRWTKLRVLTLNLYTAVLTYLIGMSVSHEQNLRINYTWDTTNGKPSFKLVAQLETDLKSFVKEWPRSTLPIPLREDPGTPYESTDEEAEQSKKLLTVVDSTLRQNTTENVTRELHDILSKEPLYERFRDWSRPHGQILWISGIDGHARTLLLNGVVKALPLGAGFRCVAYSFPHGRPWFHGITAVLRDLVRCIMNHEPQLADHLQRKLETTDKQSLDYSYDCWAWLGIFNDMINDPRFPPTYCVVDFTYECCHTTTEESTNNLVEFILRSTSMSNSIRWLVSGEVEDKKIRERLFTDFKAGHLDMSPASRLFQPVMSSYVQYLVTELAQRNAYDEELMRIIERELAQFRGYIWLDVACEILRPKKLWDIEEALIELKTRMDLSSLYRYANDELEGSLSIKERNSCTSLLSTLAITYRPLYMDELNAFVDSAQRVDLPTIVQRCSAFIRVTNGIVTFRHYSGRNYVRRYILDDAAISNAHLSLVNHCFSYLHKSLGSLTTSRHHDRGRAELSAPMAKTYASLYWMAHIPGVSNAHEDPNILNGLDQFLNEDVLFWVDALDRTNDLSHTAARLRHADFLLRSTVS